MSEKKKQRKLGADWLEHHGIKGQKWGVRRKNPSESSVPSSEDHIRTSQLRDNIKTHGTHVVSNKELQDVITRMNLEQNYSRLSTQKSTINTGHTAVKNILSVAKTAAEIHSLMKNPLYAGIKNALKK